MPIAITDIFKNTLLAVVLGGITVYIISRIYLKRRMTSIAEAIRQKVETVIPSLVLYGPHGKGGSISGHEANKWEDVRSAFEMNFSKDMELGAQLGIYFNNDLVVELSGRSSVQLNYSRDSLQCVFSSGKNMEAICIMLLVEKGKLAYEDLVSKHWPEFGCHGKEYLTISDVLRHEGGLPFFVNPTNTDNSKCDYRLKTEHIMNVEPMEKIIENSFKYGDRHYHATTRGWIISSIIRRVDEKKRTLAQFMREEICEPLNLSIYCGIPIDQQSRHHFADIALPKTWYLLSHLILPAFMGLGLDRTLPALLKTGTGKFSRRHRTTTFGKNLFKWINTPEARALEWPSVNIHANANSIAKLAMLLANGGELDGVRLLSQATVDLALSEPKAAYDPHLQSTFAFTKGGFAQFEAMEAPFVSTTAHSALKGFYGWGGVGGSWFLFHPTMKVGLGYAGNGLALRGLGGPTSDRIFKAVQKVLKSL